MAGKRPVFFPYLQPLLNRGGVIQLLNQGFTTIALQNDINSRSFPVVHIASHAQFSSQANETFILAWDSRINVSQLDSLLRVRNQNQSSRNAIELLVLSACQEVGTRGQGKTSTYYGTSPCF